MTSFFTERTAEYSLLPPLVSYLVQRFGCAVPIYFWKSREGNSVAKEIHKSRQVRLIAIYARRPKISNDDGIINGKLNASLIDYAQAAHKVGIPTFAGFPAANNIFDLNTSRTVWFSLKNLPIEDFYFQLNTSHSNLVPYGFHRPVNTIEHSDIAQAISEEATPHSWENAMQLISRLRIGDGMYFWAGRFIWTGGYKPVYILIPENQ